MATLTWDAVGGNPGPGDPGAFDDLARSFSDTAAGAQEARGKLERFGRSVDGTIWRGDSADAFRDKIGELPPRLARLHRSYDTAADGMAGYGRALRAIQAEAETLLDRAQAAAQDKASQERSRDQAQAADPAAPTATHDDAIAGAQSRIDGARNRLDDLRDRRRAAERTAIGKLEKAQDQGIDNDPWWKRAWDAVDRWVDENADLLKKISAALSFIAGVLAVIPGLQGLALIVGGLALLTNLALAATGNGSWKTLLIDAALTVVGAGVGKLAVAAFKAARANKFKRCLGDPIDVATGEMVMDQVDVDLPGALPLTITRSHISSYRAGRWFGPSWASTLDQQVELVGDRAWFSGADGMLLSYRLPEATTASLPGCGPRWPLARAADGGWTVTDPQQGHTRHFPAPGPDGSSPLLAVTDRNGHRIDVLRDATGTVTEVRHSGGYHVSVDTTAGRVTALRLVTGDGEAILVRYGYDAYGRLTEVFNSSGRPMTFAYDTAGRVTGWEDHNGCWYRYSYDDEGRCVRTEGAGGCLDGTFAYDSDRRVTVATDSLGHATTFRLNRLHQVVGEIDPLGGGVVSEWDRDDHLLARTDQLGRTTSYAYDGDNLVGVTRPDGSRITAEYTGLGLPVRVVEPDGAEWQQAYDEQGNVTTAVDPTGATTTYTYDDRGHLSTVTDALGQRQHVECDGAGLPIAVSSPHGATTAYGRDAFGRVTSITDPVGGVTRLSWSVEGELVARTLPDGATERWAYDGEGNLVEHVDPVGGVTRTEIGHFDLPAAETGPDGARTAFAHDTELRLVAVTNPQGLVWRYDYDAAGNLVAETDFNGRRLAYTHDAAGQLVERANAAGEKTLFVHDVLGNIVERRSDDITTFDYDLTGRMVRVTNADATVVFERDPAGRVRAEACDDHTVTSAYDALGRRVCRRTPSGADSIWEYDANDLPVALHSAGHTIRFAYDAASREMERLLGAARVARTWDANDRLSSQIVTAAGAAPPGPTRPPETVVQHRTYSYRADGYVTVIGDHLSGSRAFDLDPVGQVTAVRGTGWSERYAYDLAGNVTQADWPVRRDAEPASADARGKRHYAGTLIQHAGRVRYEHDAEGRVVLRQQKRPSAKPSTWRYSWDADDRLVSVTTPDGQRWRYRYDGLGRRVKKQRLATKEDTVLEEVAFAWDGMVLAEQTRTDWDTGSERTTVWEWEPGTFHPLSQTERIPTLDAPQGWIDERFYMIVNDVVGTPQEMLDPAGHVTWHRRQTLWGSGIGPALYDADCPLRFPGQYHDSETHLSYSYYRYYDPAAARFQSSDPIGQDGSSNPHAYVLNPLGWLDPLGLTPCRGALGRLAFRMPGIGAKSRLFGDVYSGAARPGMLNPPGKAARWALGWSGKKVGTGARTVFRAKVAGRKLDLFHGPWR